ncbi:ABC transporter ATP-binding protein [Nocardia stercoris]|uniref:ATP-binding cassette domain-containing protein n=1 Tax=Nocardia stercoris TaxID=2483361 RepID=A0A3M2L8C7_9NOCA|nr:ATP-binding cassette domain-containing protein [Nocardia stercoris]RMI32763.1 ATP-binding cassette domain-containing protein [Nocardia stercoris]
MIEAKNLTKRYGPRIAVDDLSFTVASGRITGFLGPNGAGKSTTMRLLLGLDRPDGGTATIAGRRYRDLRQPLRVAGALLDAKAVHSGRSVHNHLLALAHTQGIAATRIAEVLDLVGLRDVARTRAGNLSLGMGQRLGIAAALLGDPQVLILDEPLNGLDPEGIVWVRTLLQQLAAEGRTVLLSSHLMNEMAVTAEHLVIIGRGRLIADCSVTEFVERHSEHTVLVHSPDAAALRETIVREGATATAGGRDRLVVSNMAAQRIGELAAATGAVLYEVTARRASLEDAFMELTRESTEYFATATRKDAA